MPYEQHSILIETETKTKAKKPGGQHQLNDEYFKRIEALNFTLEHDDGQNTDTISGAEIILVGVSRTPKHQHVYISQIRELRRLTFL